MIIIKTLANVALPVVSMQFTALVAHLLVGVDQKPSIIIGIVVGLHVVAHQVRAARRAKEGGEG